MQIVIFGATGRIGQRVLQEALTRGHTVTAALRHTSRLDIAHDRLQTVTADVTIADEVARAADGKDAIISAIGPGPSGDPGVIVAAARAFVVALAARPTYLIAVGGAGTLEIRPGVQRLDTPDFPEAYRPSRLCPARGTCLVSCQQPRLVGPDPPIIIEPGSRTGVYRTGDDQVLFDQAGRSRISMEDFAVALIDEVEHPRHVRKRFTVAD